MTVVKYDCKCGGRFSERTQLKHLKTKKHLKYSNRIYSIVENNIINRKFLIYMEDSRIQAIEDKRIRDEQRMMYHDDICYLSVPYCDRFDAKRLGCTWDHIRKRWYIHSGKGYYEDCVSRWMTKQKLEGEDRKFGGNELFVDLIPKTSYYENARKAFPRSEWDKIRFGVYDRADYKCECCNACSKLEAHERWHYDFKTKTQKLVRIVALCRPCHRVTHMGHSYHNGWYQETYNHLIKVRGFTDNEAGSHLDEAYAIHKIRGNVQWTIDLSLLVNNGFKLK